MSIRMRLIGYTLLILIATLAFGAVLAVWHAERSVQTELAAAMEVGLQTVRDGLDGVSEATDKVGETRRLISVFDGNRHVVAKLHDAAGAIVAVSQPLLPEDHVPNWFLWAVAPRLDPLRIELPVSSYSGGIVLSPFPNNEASEVWTQYGDSGLTLVAFCLLTSLLILFAVGRGLQPLGALSVAFARIGAGDYETRLVPAGAPELIAMAEGFNRMAMQLAAMQRQNRRLREQLLTLQDEERAELARDLHDEIGPYLFSVNVSVSTARQLAEADRVSEIPGQLRDIREAVGHMQKHVRSILARLRPVPALEFGLAQAITDLVVFWRARRGDVVIHAAVDGPVGNVEEAIQEVAYRVVQESMSNALRHGRPQHIRIAVTIAAAEILIQVTDDSPTLAAVGATGFGLAGMRERVENLGGALAAGRLAGAPGWEVRAVLPTAMPAILAAAA